jgi:hypothetical protein
MMLQNYRNCALFGLQKKKELKCIQFFRKGKLMFYSQFLALGGFSMFYAFSVGISTKKTLHLKL